MGSGPSFAGADISSSRKKQSMLALLSQQLDFLCMEIPQLATAK